MRRLPSSLEGTLSKGSSTARQRIRRLCVKRLFLFRLDLVERVFLVQYQYIYSWAHYLRTILVRQ